MQKELKISILIYLVCIFYLYEYLDSPRTIKMLPLLAVIIYYFTVNMIRTT